MIARSARAAAAALALAAAAAAAELPGAGDACVACHEHSTWGIVRDWRASRHAAARVGCRECHGADHLSATDAARAVLPTPETCGACHARQVEQFLRGKHARAWDAVEAIPTFHGLSRSVAADRVVCGACHRIGVRSPARSAALRAAGELHGLASCDACHTRHLFSAAEARRPEACRSCHDGDHLQWSAWIASKHGIRHQVVTSGLVPEGAVAPTCHDCHMPGADHAVRAPWGSLGMRLPLPEDPGWARDRATLFRALGVLDAQGGDGPRLRAVMDAGTAHLEQLDYDGERARLVRVCQGCHASAFVWEQLGKRDDILRQADRVVAEAVRALVPLYERGILPATDNGRFPDLVGGADRSPVERRLADLFFEHRARLLATAFHLSPRWAEARAQVEREASEIRREAARLAGTGHPAAAKKPARR